MGDVGQKTSKEQPKKNMFEVTKNRVKNVTKSVGVGCKERA